MNRITSADTASRKEKGMIGEDLVAEHLSKQNYEIIARNYNSSYGEIDLICFKQNELVFFEVKLRKKSFDEALFSITDLKKKRIIRTALSFLQQYPEYEEYLSRFDVIAVQKTNRPDEYRIRHIENAFTIDEVEFDL